MFTALLFLTLPTPAPVKPDLEAERIRIAVAVAIEIANAKTAPAPKIDPTPAVVVQRPFTPTGTPMRAPYVAAPNTASVVTYPMARTRTLAPWTGQFGATANCTYG